MLPHSILRSFDRYDDLLDLHTEKISDLANKPDFTKMQFQRANVFAELKNQLTCFVKNSKKGSNGFKEAAEACQKRMESILQKDVFLRRRMSDYQHELQHRKTLINKGKIALNGYGGTSLSNLMHRKQV
jgi:methylthioribose-1-phosphate isomerase